MEWRLKLLEVSQRVGGQVKTIRDPFTPGLHSEGVAMRLPSNHVLVRTYLKKMGLDSQLENFEQENMIIYISTYGIAITYDEFNKLLTTNDTKLLKSFPNLKENEKGKTIDQLWNTAVLPVTNMECLLKIKSNT